jgi:hypothetical protein
MFRPSRALQAFLVFCRDATAYVTNITARAIEIPSPSARRAAFQTGIKEMRVKRTKIAEYRAGARRWEQRANKTRCQVDREWQMTLARAYLMLAEAERAALLAKGSPLNELAA